MALVESIDDPALTIALSFAGVVAKHETGESEEALRWTQAVIDLAVEGAADRTAGPEIVDQECDRAGHRDLCRSAHRIRHRYLRERCLGEAD